MRSQHQRRCVRDATAFEFFISFYCKTTIGQGTIAYLRGGGGQGGRLPPLTSDKQKKKREREREGEGERREKKGFFFFFFFFLLVSSYFKQNPRE